MFFATTTPARLHQHIYSSAGRSLERFLQDTQRASQSACELSQDERSYTLQLDMPGVGKEHVDIGIEGKLVRVNTREGAPRSYSHAWELPLEIDTATSEARLEHGVLTLKLGKLLPVSRVTNLAVQ